MALGADHLPKTWDLPAAIVQRLGQKSVGKQRCMAAEGHLLLILHRPPQPGQHRQREGIYGWRDPQGQWRTQQGLGVGGLRQNLLAYQKAEEVLHRAYEQAATAQDYFTLLEQVAPLQLAVRNLHMALQGAREAVPGDLDLIDLRDEAGDVERSLDLLYLNSKNALDFAMALQSERQAELSARLNILLSIFLPLTAMGSLLGMNLTTGLELQSPLLFWALVAGGLYGGLGVCQWVMTGDRPDPQLRWLRRQWQPREAADPELRRSRRNRDRDRSP
jgi:hypothetical protein